MGVVKNLVVRAGFDGSELEKGLKNMSKSMKRAGKELTAIGKNMTMSITVPVVAAGAAAFKLASDMEESLNKVNVAFGDSSKEVTDWSNTTLKSFGIAKNTSLDMAAGFGDMATSMGLNTGEASKMATSMVGLAGDLASFKNIGMDEANTALTSIFTGETESLKKMGIVMTQANLNAYALASGMGKTVQQMTQAEQVQLRYNYVMEMTKNAQGDFARTSDGAANQMRIFTESLKEFGATMGAILLPIITPMIAKLNEMVQWFGSLDESTKKNIVTFLLIAATIGPLLMIFGALMTSIGQLLMIGKTFVTIFTGVKLLFTVLTGPIGLVILAIGLLIAAGILLYKNWDTVKAKLDVVGAGIKSAWGGVKDFVLGIWDGIVGGIKGSINKIISAMNGMIRGMNKLQMDVPSWVPLIGGKKWGFNIPQIPALAEGGIVNRPTLALIGEAGPEKVTPLDKSNSGMNVTVNVRSPFDVAKELSFLDKKLAWGL